MSNEEAVSGIEQLNIADNELMVANADNVGDTTYSATWILRRLLTLSKINEEPWSTDLETDFCYLWDMTTEKDIVDFLCQNNFLSVSEFVIDNAPEPRCREIIVGILGNLCSQPTAFTRITNTPTLVTKLLSLMSSDDTETLIQVLRVLQAGSRDMQITITSPWREYLLYSKPLADALTFIFNSSTNSQLLRESLALMHTIATNTIFFNEIFDINPLLVGLVETFDQLMPSEQEEEAAEDDENESNDQVVIERWLEIIVKILERQSTTRINNYKDIIRVVIKILGKLEENMIPMDENKASSIYDCVAIANWLKKHRYHVDIKFLCPLTKIMIKLDDEISKQQENDKEIMVDLLKHLHRYWLGVYGASDELITDEYLSTCPSEVSRYLMNYIFNGTRHYNKF
ncbi:GSCOCG00010828001-RA-CDS [Cotesia congregata]|nr:GSCOCG00010828001-RA-CDS [Cotesia congregata]